MIDFRTKDTKTTIISGYQPFYIQQAGGGTAVDTRTQWGMVAKTNPYPVLPTPKEPYANNWLDENGLDEYNEQMYYEPTEFEVAFYIKAYASGGNTASQILRSWIQDFFDYVKAGEFRTYDSYTGVGFRKVRFNGYNEDYFRARGTWAATIIVVKFKANDPVSKVSLSNGSILPPNVGTTSTGGSTSNKVVTMSTGSITVTTGVQLAVTFTNANTASSVALKIGNNGTAYPVIHVPGDNFKASTTYFFQFTGSTWDCLGKL